MDQISNQSQQVQKPFRSQSQTSSYGNQKHLNSHTFEERQLQPPSYVNMDGTKMRMKSNKIEPRLEGQEHELSNRAFLKVEPIPSRQSKSNYDSQMPLQDRARDINSSQYDSARDIFITSAPSIKKSNTQSERLGKSFDLKGPNEEFLLNEMKAKNKTIIELISFDAEDIRVTNQAFRKLQIAEYSVSFMILLSIGCSVMANELDYFQDHYENSTKVTFLFRLVLGSNIVTLCLTYARYQKFLEWAIVKSYYTKIDTLRTTGKLNEMIIECIVLMIGPYEFFNTLEFTFMKKWDRVDSDGKGIMVLEPYKYKVNTVLMILSFLKGIVMLRSITYFTRFTSPRAQRVCAMNGTRANLLFAVKALMKDKPFHLLFSAFLGTSLIFAFFLQVLERPLQVKKFHDFNYLGDGLWLVLVTMTTVGYGDLYPVTVGGRIMGVFICIWGLFLTSFFTVTLTNYLQFKQGQSKAYILLQRLHYKEKLQKEAVRAMSTLYRYRLLQKEMNKTQNKDTQELESETRKALSGKLKLNPQMLRSARDFRKQMVKFKETTKQIHSYHDGDNFQVTLLSKEIDDLQGKVGRLEEEMKVSQAQQVQMNTKLDLILAVLQQKDAIKVEKQKSGERRNNYVKRHGVPLGTIEISNTHLEEKTEKEEEESNEDYE